MTATDDLLARADAWDVSTDPYWPGELIRELAAALRATETQRDAAYAVIRAVDQVWPLNEVPWEPDEAEAIAHATRTEKNT